MAVSVVLCEGVNRADFKDIFAYKGCNKPILLKKRTGKGGHPLVAGTVVLEMTAPELESVNRSPVRHSLVPV